MKQCDRSVLYTVHSAQNRPSCTVEPGEEFQVLTQLNTGEWLQSAEDEWHPSKITGPNFTNCIEVAGAKTGDVLAVDILNIQVDSLAYTGFASWRNPPCQRIYPNNWDIVAKIVEIKDDEVQWNSRLRLRTRPMIGTIGVAPAAGEIPNGEAGRHGGNMDVQEVCAGTTVYLPVNVAGALLHVGDVHAIMGDGEINRAGGLECRGTLTLRCRLLPAGPGFQWIRLENEEYIMAVACVEDMETAFYEAAGELIRWMEHGYGFRPQDAYCLLGQVMEARCTAIVNLQKPYICKIKKAYLRAEEAETEKKVDLC